MGDLAPTYAIQKPVYLDYNATTPVDKRVLEVMLPFFTEKFGNPSSAHHPYGKEAAAAIHRAREQVAALIHAEPSEIIFTSGATEANNLALKGIYEQYTSKGNHIITCVTEHNAILEPCKSLAKKGADITYLPVNNQGAIDLHTLEDAITPKTILICLMFANNETGVIHPIEAIGNIARKHGIFFFTDASQAAGKIPIDVQAMPIDLMSFTGHKFYGPKGVGALYIRRKNPRVSLQKQMDGGGQERGLRSGTLHVTGIVGLGAAAELCSQEMAEDSKRLSAWQQRLEAIISQLPDTFINGAETARMPHVSNVIVKNLQASALISALSPHMAISGGSACSSGSGEPSHVLQAMLGTDADPARNAILRISMGRFTTEEDVDTAIEALQNQVLKLRENMVC